MPESPPVRLPSDADSKDQHKDVTLSCDLCKATSKGRNIILCFDGTSNQFGQNNTNVVELYSRIIKDESQVTYYNSGIGTYARPSWRSYKHWKQVFSSKIDLAIAWNFEKIVITGYRWLSEHYVPGDKIFLFGFSRGAYQVRALAGMILKVGLILPGNEEQIPFAYELFADLGKRANRSQKASSDSKDGTSSAEKRENRYERMAERFKDTFSRKDVKVHFLAAWDTVSSIGVIRGKSLPYTNEFNNDVCFFRHALALDERRIKFLPEYICGGESYIGMAGQPRADSAKKEGVDAASLPGPRVKEVWFAGCHSDIGGGNQPNEELNNAAVPVLWMGNEAFLAGLRLEQSKLGESRVWDWEKLKDTKPRESLGFIWWLFEILPFRRLSYINEQHTVWWPHVGKGRVIKPGQKIHASVAFIQNYQPRATFSGDVKGGDWLRILTTGRADDLDWIKNIKDLLELDLFDYSRTPIMIKGVKENMNTESIKVLELFASTPEGWQAIITATLDFSLFAEMAGETDEYTRGVGERMLDRLVRHVRGVALNKERRHEMVETGVVRSLANAIEIRQPGAQKSKIHQMECLLYTFLRDDDVQRMLSNEGNILEALSFSGPFGELAKLHTIPPSAVSTASWLESICELQGLEFFVGLMAILPFSKQCISGQGILDRIIRRCTEENLLLRHEYGAKVLCRLVDAAVSKSRQPVSDDVVEYLFHAIPKQPFALDVFRLLLAQPCKVYISRLYSETLSKINVTDEDDEDELCAHLQALELLAGKAMGFNLLTQEQKKLETLYELVKSTSFNIKYCALRALVTLGESEDTREIVESLVNSKSDPIIHRRAIRWLKDSEGSLAIQENKDHLDLLVTKLPKENQPFDAFVRSKKLEVCEVDT